MRTSEREPHGAVYLTFKMPNCHKRGNAPDKPGSLLVGGLEDNHAQRGQVKHEGVRLTVPWKVVCRGSAGQAQVRPTIAGGI